MFSKYFVITLTAALLHFCFCDNVTERYLGIDFSAFQQKQHRLLTFNTEDDGAVAVELAFNVPFLKIPVKKSVDMAKHSLANINLGAVMLSGMMVLSAAVAIPAIHYLASKTGDVPKNTGNQKYKSDGDGDGNLSDFWKLMAGLERSLMNNNIDLTSCTQRVVCLVVKNSTTKLSKGTASSSDKIVDGVATNEWFSQLIRNTIFDEAVKEGLSGTSCSKMYRKCKITQRTVQKLAKQVVNALKLKT